MEYFVQQLINGITLGSIYGLIAIGYTMVYGIIGMVNFAHGDVFMVSAFIALCVNLAFPLYQREQQTVFGTTSPFWDAFARFDSGHFEGIAWGGYAPAAGGRNPACEVPTSPCSSQSTSRSSSAEPTRSSSGR